RGGSELMLGRLLDGLSCAYKYRDLTVREITNVTTSYKDLKPVMDNYVFNDGSTRELMSLSGTVPVSYRGMKLLYGIHKDCISLIKKVFSL
uniref:UEV domain-containing protein n=1 Tax=Astyanax mexicanus TaxID=7994 RepID=A0A8B9HQC0_ASTMX